MTPSQRDEAAVSFQFDRAYSTESTTPTFGLTPSFDHLLPHLSAHRPASGPNWPVPSWAGCTFAALAFLLWQAAALFGKKRPLGYLTWLGAFLAAAGASTVLFDVRSGNYYYLAQISAMTFFLPFWGWSFAGYNASRRRWMGDAGGRRLPLFWPPPPGPTG